MRQTRYLQDGEPMRHPPIRPPRTSEKDWVIFLQNQRIVDTWNTDLKAKTIALQRAKMDAYDALREKKLPVPAELDPMAALIARHTVDLETDWEALENDSELLNITRSTTPAIKREGWPEGLWSIVPFILGLAIVIFEVAVGPASPAILIAGAALMGWPAWFGARWGDNSDVPQGRIPAYRR